ncbi:MgtC/SapB family protein [Glaciibacter psychrotolerans]|uniref:Putative Mg2+ transporter-C (MgtC) family protein n=1 Tax=Glaciibacter psychrotolerans TaxID=670054 RepID=A0A7Z0EGF3_9MICO|nr:MgtC/SapB family protein [Leifsonia psychrotolerans]NYJ20770.1 putative Mg2+ transporter-C (MgtC) family protein [Leifsonia psychrotolerans]
MLQLEFVSDSTLTQIFLLLLAFVLCAIVGVERQRKLKSAGLRTHTLVGLGAAVFTLVSAYGFSNVIGPEVVLDPSRIAAQIVSGIGFLGAGVIFVRQNAVNGLTTAATIWMSAAIGMACGAGMPVIAVIATILHLAAVAFLPILGRRIPLIDKDQVFVVSYKENRGVLRDILHRATELGYEASLTKTRRINIDGKVPRVEADMRFRHGRGPLEDLVEGLAEIRGVISVQVTKDEND